MRQFNSLLIVFLLLIFSGCSVINEYTDSYKFKYQHSTAVTNFSEITQKLIKQLDDPLVSLDHHYPIYVIDFTNIEKLENFSELGFLLSSEIKTHVTQRYDWPVEQIEYMKYLKVGAKGTKLFSRDIKDLKNIKLNSSGYALVGTYAFTQRQLILYLKLIDLQDGKILKSATYATEQTDEIINLEKKHRKTNPNNIYQPMVL